MASALAVTVIAQQPRSDSAVHTVRIDARVVDAKGAPVGTLTPTDFEVREDGSVLALTQARFVRIGVEPRRAAVSSEEAPLDVRSASDEEREARREGARLVAIYLDEYHISPGAGVDRARDALTSFIDRAVGPRDLLVVMKPLDSLLTIRLTHDREQARRMVASLEGRKGDYTPRNDYERTSMTGSMLRVETARTQVGISALHALAVHMASLNELRKTLIVVTEGLTRPSRSRGQEYLATVDAVLRSANRANVSIYPIDPRAATAADAVSDDERAVIGSLARDTDGRAVAGAADLGAALTAALADASAYYLLTYEKTHREDGAFHPVQVRVKRAGVQVSARSGYWAPSIDDRLRAELAARASRPPEPIKLEPARRISPLIQPWFGVSQGEGRTTRVTFVWEPAVRVPGERGRVTPARLDLTVLGSGDAVLFQGMVLPSGPGMLEELGAESSRAVFDVAPGRLRIRMKILDAARREIDSDVRDVAIRDLRTQVSIGTPELLRARNAREYRTIDADPDALPVAAREFSRTEHLLVRFPVYAPNGQEPSVSVRLLNRGGQPMRTLDLRTTNDGEREFDLALAALATGEYQLEFSASAASGQTKETLGFRVTS